MTEQELTDDIKDTLEVMNKLYRGYIEQDEKEYKIALLISLRIGAVAIADEVTELKKILQNTTRAVTE